MVANSKFTDDYFISAAHVYICIDMYIHTYICMYVCVCVAIYIYVCMHTYNYVASQLSIIVSTIIREIFM